MAHTRSAKKRIRQNTERRARNRWYKRRIRERVRGFEAAAHDGDIPAAEQALRDASRTIDRVAAKGSIHKNAAARHKSRLARRLSALKTG